LPAARQRTPGKVRLKALQTVTATQRQLLPVLLPAGRQPIQALLALDHSVRACPAWAGQRLTCDRASERFRPRHSCLRHLRLCAARLGPGTGAGRARPAGHHLAGDRDSRQLAAPWARRADTRPGDAHQLVAAESLRAAGPRFRRARRVRDAGQQVRQLALLVHHRRPSPIIGLWPVHRGRLPGRQTPRALQQGDASVR
jgi:hypothetical protein